MELKKVKRYHQLLFICLFLLVIFSVPVVQTIYEFSKNENHRIQMLDIIEDTFIDPVRKADNDLKIIQGILKSVENIEGQSSLLFTGQENSGQSTALNNIDESVFKLTALIQNVVNYNRHINNETSKFLSKDTTSEYYRLLIQIQKKFGSLSENLLNGGDPSIVSVQNSGENPTKKQMFELKKDIEKLRKIRYDGNSFLRNMNLILKAMNRNLVGADYLRPYEKEMEKSSVFANNIRPVLLFSYFALYGDLGDKGVQGKNGWIFYRPDIDYLIRPSITDSRNRFIDPNDAPLRDSVIDTIVAFKEQLSAKGIDLLVVIMPGKPSIYPDLLNNSLVNKSAVEISHSPEIIGKLEKKGVDVVDLFSALWEERKRDGQVGDSIYLQTDTHFKGRGVLAVASAVAQQVKKYPWFEPGSIEYSTDSVDVPRNGDIGEMTTLPAMRLRGLEFTFAAEKTKCYQVYRISRDEGGNEIQRSLYKDDYQRSKILVLGDSFSRIYQTDEPRSAGWISHLAKELGQPLASIVNDGGASTLVRKTLERKSSVLRGKKLVIWEIVERDFRYGADGWKNVKL
jgi:hypothetical protein